LRLDEIRDEITELLDGIRVDTDDIDVAALAEIPQAHTDGRAQPNPFM
jgi:hypothetical protein